MAMDATLQIRMNSDLKDQVEEPYRNMGTLFTEAVRIFELAGILGRRHRCR